MTIQARFLCCLALLFPASAAGDVTPTARELLAEFQKTAETISRFRIETVEKHWKTGDRDERSRNHKDGYSGTENRTICFDGSRWRFSTDRTNILTFDGIAGVHRSGLEYLLGDYLGKRQALRAQWISDEDNLNSKLRKIAVWLENDVPPEEARQHLSLSNILFGRTNLDGPEPLWQTMGDASSLELSSERKSTGKASTYVLKSRGRYGIHTLWLDPAAGYLPRRIAIDKRSGDLVRESQLGVEQSPAGNTGRKAAAVRMPTRVLDEMHTRWDDIEIAQRQGTFVITGFTLRNETSSRVGDQAENVSQKTEYRATVIDIDPETWPPDAFLPGVQIPEGTKVDTTDVQARLIWSKGQVRRSE